MMNVPLRRRISEVLGDGAYDTKECHKALKKKDKTTSPPREGMQDDGKLIILEIKL